MNFVCQFNVYFDGGTDGCSGGPNGYGSWQVEFNGFVKTASRVPFIEQRIGQQVTNNVAEWLALIGALAWLQSVKQRDKYHVTIHGDSQLVLRQLSGEYKVRKQHLKPLATTAHRLLNGFQWTTRWQRREHNVKRFGH